MSPNPLINSSESIPLCDFDESSDLDGLVTQDAEKQPIKHRSRLYIVCLNLGMAGVQVAFSIQFASATQYFKSIGISQVAATLLWLIPPICGSLLQPLFGRWSDAYGKRKPFIMAGAMGIIVSLLGYAWGPDLAVLLSPSSAATLSQLLVPFFFLTLNVAVQPVQTGLRALVVDKCDAAQQAEATAWASRISFLASMACYLAASRDLADGLPGKMNQLQALVSLAIVMVVVSVSVTCSVASEGAESRAPRPPKAREGIMAIWTLLSPRLRRIYIAQFFSWFAWFPILVQISSYINTLACAAEPTARREESKCESAGASALFDQACVALVMSVTLPPLIELVASLTQKGQTPESLRGLDPDYRSRPGLRVGRMVWLASQVLVSVLLLSMTALKSARVAILATAVSGACWCVTQWLPFTLANEEVIQIERRRRTAGLGSRTGLLLGAHNIFIAAPQVLATVFSSVLFQLLDLAGETDRSNQIVGVFGASIASSLVAAILISRL
ncbi:uncharacterized protein PpBr36_10613 [Pyricularia pennisetigena]|uniref:uncharacterized protein n=1 Tax=Pyricularia pennisetigena TaxID=1578925 RepID=UPI0011503E50|nr:uncharacterized protein PpBr36_10613 [Pyricularia pennisetigena]TLS21209.1 hypothetical protein PpBr36_10613 [Pyricularia pennisetigena]